MAQTIRISLPGYNALTDTNLDHYSLFADQDNILIKEFVRGTVNFKYSNYTSGYQITHNLGYVPHFLVFVKDAAGYVFYGSQNNWLQIGNANLQVAYFAYADTTKLYIFDGTNQATDYVYYIFYDYQVGSSGQSITQSDKVVKVSKAGVNVLTSVDPNDYIFHSDLNTFKIIKEGIATINCTGNGLYSFDHGASISSPAAFMTFVKFPDGSVSMGNGTFYSSSRDAAWTIQSAINSTQINNNIFGGGASGTFYVKYYIFETPLA